MLSEMELRSKTGLLIIEALEQNDPDTAMMIIADYIQQKNKSRISKNNNIPRSTLYLNLSKGANPKIRTLAKLIHACSNGGIKK